MNVPLGWEQIFLHRQTRVKGWRILIADSTIIDVLSILSQGVGMREWHSRAGVGIHGSFQLAAGSNPCGVPPLLFEKWFLISGFYFSPSLLVGTFQLPRLDLQKAVFRQPSRCRINVVTLWISFFPLPQSPFVPKEWQMNLSHTWLPYFWKVVSPCSVQCHTS